MALIMLVAVAVIGFAFAPELRSCSQGKTWACRQHAYGKIILATTVKCASVSAIIELCPLTVDCPGVDKDCFLLVQWQWCVMHSISQS